MSKDQPAKLSKDPDEASKPAAAIGQAMRPIVAMLTILSIWGST